MCVYVYAHHTCIIQLYMLLHAHRRIYNNRDGLVTQR